jgi:eukaryotic-like serine/threonine-protein kinase
MKIENGSVINQYKIISAIGKGGMGEVYLAQDTRLDRKVALKILPPEFAADRDRMNRFVREAKSASALNHPNIITIHEIGESEGRHYIATEFIDGKTLNEYAKSLSLDYESILEIAIQIASALSEAHSAGIVHRDIKPDNVMIRANGLVKLLDFGIAKPISDSGLRKSGLNNEDATLIQNNPKSQVPNPQSTTPGMIIGTANYMSPEQAKGKEVDARTDIFSFGIVLYEMIAGGLPFEGENALEMIGAILHQEPKPLNSDVPPEIAKIINKCLRKDRDERYQTIKDVGNDLKDVKQDLEFQDKLERSIVPNQEANKTQILKATTLDEINQTTTNQTVASNPQIKYITAGLLTLLLAIGGFFSYRYFTPTKQIESIAVMPFVNESGNADNEYLSDGMTETLISSLSQLPNLNVKARSSVFRYKGKETGPQTIGKELNVQAILSGRVTQRGDLLTLSVEVVDAITENVIWSESYNRKQIDLTTLQSEIARDVSNKLRTKLSAAKQNQVAKNYTTNPEAYQLYLKGRFFWNKRTKADIQRSIEYFNQAIALDPVYALAYAGLADAYQVLPNHTNNPPPEETYPKARAAAQKALEIDANLAEPHAALGVVLHEYEWKFAEAENEFKRAIELNPNYASAHQWYGEYLINMGRFDEGIAETRRAQELDPLSLIINSIVGFAYYAVGRHDEAIAQYRKTLEIDPNFPSTHAGLLDAYIEKGMYKEAIEQNRKLDILDGLPPEQVEKRTARLKEAVRKSGERGFWQQYLEFAQEFARARNSEIAPNFHAYLQTKLGNKEQALDLMEKSFADGKCDFCLKLKSNPVWNPLRTEPRFQELLRKVGFPE